MPFTPIILFKWNNVTVVNQSMADVGCTINDIAEVYVYVRRALSAEQPYITIDEQWGVFPVPLGRQIQVRLTATVTENAIDNTVKTIVTGTAALSQIDEAGRGSIMLSSDPRFTDYSMLVTRKFSSYSWQDALSAVAALINGR